MIFDPTDIEKAAKKAGLTLPELYERAGIARSTFERWRQGLHSPHLSTIVALNAAIRGERVKSIRKKRAA